MTRIGLWVAALAASVLAMASVAEAVGEGPVSLTIGSLKITENGELFPRTLSRTKHEPIGLQLTSQFRTVDGSHLPALEGLVFDGDRDAEISTKGIPTCSAAELQSRDTREAEAACRSAIIGTGYGTAEVDFPEQKTIKGGSRLLVFNGGTDGSTTTWYVHAFARVPSPTAFISTVEIRKVGHGRYGTESVVTIPKLVGGFGSVTGFRLNFDRTVKVGGKAYHPFVVKCSDGTLSIHIEASFSDRTQAASDLFRSCTPKGS